MEEHKHIIRHVLELDKLCFEKCIVNYERKFSIKEENCLSKLVVRFKKTVRPRC